MAVFLSDIEVERKQKPGVPRMSSASLRPCWGPVLKFFPVSLGSLTSAQCFSEELGLVLHLLANLLTHPCMCASYFLFLEVGFWFVMVPGLILAIQLSLVWKPSQSFILSLPRAGTTHICHDLGLRGFYYYTEAKPEDLSRSLDFPGCKM